ncbi:hypothetical protein BN2475_450093 [Paraburkholderia ribeironis]|uniref:Uncharacterized protein n=1 Tax=Paraburkholderia ribeironis TaxID=1247936 RepID=A0A1N7S8W1_9BURK|nr:hypothetical protein BN2475_450093 [Paraburkholderia ribeironis]
MQDGRSWDIVNTLHVSLQTGIGAWHVERLQAQCVAYRALLCITACYNGEKVRLAMCPTRVGKKSILRESCDVTDEDLSDPCEIMLECDGRADAQSVSAGKR